MLIKSKTLEGFKLNSLNGEIGKAKEFYFDDRHWTIRYLVADTGGWLTGKQVLISPYALAAADKQEEYITVDLTKQQIENSPSLSRDKPVSQQFETDYHGYYGYPMYWGGLSMWGADPYIQRDREQWYESTPAEKKGEPNLRSTREVSGYHIQATDGEIGHVEDFIIDDQTWAIRYLIVDTVNWWSGKKVLVSPRWIEQVSWEESKVFINLPREIIQRSPEYMQEILLMRGYETRLHQHYNRQGYWVDDSKDLAQPL